jgi:DNA-directed RNA polymerase subunit RPC12/RpoP
MSIFRYVCLRCGQIITKYVFQPEDKIQCPLCGYQVIYWNHMEQEQVEMDPRPGAGGPAQLYGAGSRASGLLIV